MRISDWSSDVCSSDLFCHSRESGNPGGGQPTHALDSRFRGNDKGGNGASHPRPRRAARDRRSVNMNRLGHQIGVEPFGSAFAAETRFLDTAEGRVVRRDDEAVDPDHAAFDDVGDAVDAAAVIGEGEGAERSEEKMSALKSTKQK